MPIPVSMEGAHQSTTVLALTAAAMGASLLRARPAAGQQRGGSRVGGVCMPVHTRGQAREERGSAEDLRWMKLACEQARLSPPVETAYCVGCVLVKDGEVRDGPALPRPHLRRARMIMGGAGRC